MRKERVILFLGFFILFILGMRFELKHSNRVLQLRDPHVLATASDPKTNTEALSKLVTYPNCEVRRALVLHPNLSKKDLETLSVNDPDLGVRYEAKKKLRFFPSLKKGFSPAADMSLEKIASSCLLTSETAHQIYVVAFQQKNFSRIDLLIALAKNPRTPPDILHILSLQKNILILRALASNPNLSTNLQTYLLQYPDCKVRKKLLCQPKLSWQSIRILKNDSDNSVAMAADKRYQEEELFLSDCKKIESNDTSCQIYYKQTAPSVSEMPSTSDKTKLQKSPLLSWR